MKYKKIKKNYYIPIILFISISILFFISLIDAQIAQADPVQCDPAAEVCLDNPLKTDDANILIGQIINAVLGVVGSLALVMFVYGGFTWMLAAGSPEKVKKGKDVLVWAIIGLVVIFSAYALVSFVFKGLGVK